MTKFKGPVFPSFKEQSTPPSRQQWISHSGKRQRIRYLRTICKDILNSKDPAVIESLKTARESITGKFEEYGMLMMVWHARETSESTGVPFEICLDYIVDKLKADKEKLNEEAPRDNNDAQQTHPDSMG